MEELKHVLELLTQMADEGKLIGHTLSTLYDANGDIHLTVRAVDVAACLQFIADVRGVVDEAEPEADEPEAKPRTLHELAERTLAEPEADIAALTKKLGRRPTVEEAAADAGIDMDDPFHNPANDKTVIKTNLSVVAAKKAAKLGGKKSK